MADGMSKANARQNSRSKSTGRYKTQTARTERNQLRRQRTAKRRKEVLVSRRKKEAYVLRSLASGWSVEDPKGVVVASGLRFKSFAVKEARKYVSANLIIFPDGTFRKAA